MSRGHEVIAGIPWQFSLSLHAQLAALDGHRQVHARVRSRKPQSPLDGRHLRFSCFSLHVFGGEKSRRGTLVGFGACSGRQLSGQLGLTHACIRHVSMPTPTVCKSSLAL